MSKPKVTCTILTYNEAARIRIALAHAFKWADEVVVVDKGSTDPTCEIAHQMGARIYDIRFSRQGHEDMSEYVQATSHDWIWAFTPGEAIVIPMKYYSFGLHHGKSPWSWSGQLRLFNRKRVEFTGVCHNAITAKRIVRMDPNENCYILHQTHSDADSFMRAHADYMKNEAQNGTPEEVMQRAGGMIKKYGHPMAEFPELQGQLFGWQIYWLGVAMHAWFRQNPDVRDQYAKRAGEMLLLEWL
jgi:hypothetical protein